MPLIGGWIEKRLIAAGRDAGYRLLAQSKFDLHSEYSTDWARVNQINIARVGVRGWGREKW